MSYFYQIYGLSIKSDIQFPELLTTLDFFSVDNTITISIKKNKPKPLKAPLSKGAFYQINAKTLLQYIPSIGYLSIRNGKTITIFPKMNIDEDSLREAVLNIGIKAILCQRNFFVMQGTTIKLHDSCFAIVGASGAGKSTLAAALFKNGYSILSDDFVVMNLQGYALSGYPFLKLWFESLKNLNFDCSVLKKIRPQIHKYLLPLESNFHYTALPVKGIYFLQDVNNDEYKFETITGVKKIKVLQNLISNKVETSVTEQKRLSYFVTLAQQIVMESIIRPHDDFKLEECTAHIEKNLGRFLPNLCQAT